MPAPPPRLLAVLHHPMLPQYVHGFTGAMSLATAGFAGDYLQSTSCDPYVSAISKTGAFQFMLLASLLSGFLGLVWFAMARHNPQWYTKARLLVMAVDVVAFVLVISAATAVNFSAAGQYVCTNSFSSELNVMCNVNCGALNGSLITAGLVVLALLFSVLAAGYQFNGADRRPMFLVQTPTTKSATLMETPRSDCFHVQLETPTMAV
ncbi:hypothetical protein ACHHYP_00599 [Achlya hypogyna]|uniref:MARVEL domain-containing protein n=1 Tax=Achlya hypogyna TaxID=1202772 RepID=A0A1V9ZUC2_ACHHY|nr:hypothetical protein ACHHYP_00599 [Achlya hypogyna]